MDLGPILLALALVLLVAAFIARPLLERSAPPTEAAHASDLITQREAILTELRDLDFDHSTGKVAGDDYETQRARLVAKGAEILRALDRLPASDSQPAAMPDALDDEIERLVAGRRHAVANATAVTKPCPKCGNAVLPDDKFCPRCGTRLA